MTMSIVHRATGIALYGGTLLLVLWLLAAAIGGGFFDGVIWLFASWLGQLVLFGYTFALLLHLFGGLRHAIWDAGKGFEPEARDRLAYGSVAAAAAATVLLWIVSFIIR